jgi:hypothetical protein
MTKLTISITIDPSIYYKLKEDGINISGLINRLLDGYVGQKPPVKEDLEILKEKAEKQASELSKSRDLINEIEEKLKKEEKERIERDGIPFKLPCQQ